MITIIVLLILAGVTISLVMGDSGVFTQAKDASIKTTKADLEEALGRAVASAEGEYTTTSEFSSGRQTFYEWLKGNSDKLKENGYTIIYGEETTDKDGEKCVEGEITKDGKKNGLKFKLKGGETRLDVNVEILDENNGDLGSGGITAKEIEEDPKEYYGKYVDYGLDLSGDENTKNDWKIFYTDETTNRIFLIAADYVPNNEGSALSSALTSSHLHADSSKTGQSYMWNDGNSDDIPEYHCNDNHNLDLNSEEDQCSFPEIFMLTREDNADEHTNNHYYCSSHTTYNNSKCASSLQCTTNWKPFVEQSSKKTYAEYAIGGPTLEMWVASWNKVHGTGKDSNGQSLFANGNGDSGDGYFVGTSEDCDINCYSLMDCDGYNDSLYFPHHKNSNCAPSKG